VRNSIFVAALLLISLSGCTVRIMPMNPYYGLYGTTTPPNYHWLQPTYVVIRPAYQPYVAPRFPYWTNNERALWNKKAEQVAECPQRGEEQVNNDCQLSGQPGVRPSVETSSLGQ
jgi:hypothetical protein